MPLDQTNTFNTIVSGGQDLNAHLVDLTPTTPVHLYEIDFSEIYPQTLYMTTENQPINRGVMRVYNDINLFNLASNSRGRILWQGNYYYPFPITSEGFDLNSAGTLPSPKFYLANTSPDGNINNSFYKYARMQIQSLGDLAGCKFTRIKTFLKYLDPSNFINNINSYNRNSNIFEVELPRDIFYIDRKSLENKNTIEYSLVSILDIENVALPGRTILATKCPFQYRGEGCLYEYHTRISNVHSGVYGGCENIQANAISLPLEAPPVATDNDELFLGKIFTGIDERRVFSGIAFERVGQTTGNSTWTFTNFDLVSGSNISAQQRLSDNNFASTGANTRASIGTITISLNEPKQITRFMINSASTIQNNFNFDFSLDGNAWQTVKTNSGDPRDWVLAGRAAGSYVTGFPSVGSHRFWRLRTTNSVAGTQLTEISLSGQYRIGDSGLWGLGNRYQRGEFVNINKKGLRFYYVCVSGHTSNPFNAPPNKIFWAADSCSKSISACRLRWGLNPYFRPVLWPLHRGGWGQQWWRDFNAMFGTDASYLPGAYVGDKDIDWPRRPDVQNPYADTALGLPKDFTGDYMYGFLPFGGFPGVNRQG
jgi:lambda family phage minor tail protein L